MFPTSFHRHSLLPIACLLLSAPAFHAQTFDATHLSEPADLSMTWLLRPGDDLSWAKPAYDDSKWMIVDPKHTLTEYFPDGSHPEIVWYRLHVRLRTGQSGLAVEECRLSSAFEIYGNGKLLLANGRVVPFVPYSEDAVLIAPIASDAIAAGELTLALRVRLSAADWRQGAGLYPQNLLLGRETEFRDHFWRDFFGSNALDYVSGILSLSLGIVTLALFFVQRERTEYLWLFANSFLGAAYLVRSSSLNALNLPDWIVGSSSGLWLFVEITYIGLGLAFVRVNLRRRVKMLIGGAALLASLAVVGATLGWFGNEVRQTLWLPVLLIAHAGVPVLFIAHFRRGNREAGILLIPWLMESAVQWLYPAMFWLAQFPSTRDLGARIYQKIFDNHLGPIQLEPNGFFNCLWSISWALILVWRTIRISRDQTRMESELEAARQVQQVLLPEEKCSVPGFTVAAAYEPAQEVGGDFYQVLPTADGGLLLAIGDVAGKGMPAAMLVAVLVGALRTMARFTHDPAEILAELNTRLLGRTSGGFSTCLVVHIAASGFVSLANAGHLAPYLDGREIETPGALPLGIVAGQAYEKVNFQLEPGGRLTFYSDGVVEAQNRAGKLLGFDKARELSQRPAQEIVSTAAEFGQQDDITVLTVEWLPAAGRVAEAERVAGSATLAEMPLEPA
jgi:phosphoserine phosphatase RsbU/P